MCSRVFAVIEDDGAVDNHIGDSLVVLERIGISSSIDDRLWIEDRDVRREPEAEQYWTSPRFRSLMVLTLTLICVAFYIMRSEKDRNYGGVSCGFRWMFWFTPLWLICMLPATDAVAKHRGWRIAALAMLGVSILSATYASMNPWSHPWIFDYWTHLEWIAY